MSHHREQRSRAWAAAAQQCCRAQWLLLGAWCPEVKDIHEFSAGPGDESDAAAEGLLKRSGVELLSSLDAPDRRHLERVLRAERLFPLLIRANLGVAAILAIYYSGPGSWSRARAVVVLLILLGARAHLRQLRSARLLRKLSGSGAASS